MYSYILPLVLAFERSIWISYTGERIMLCYVLGNKGVKEENRTTSEMMQELRLMTGVVAAKVQKLWKGFG